MADYSPRLTTNLGVGEQQILSNSSLASLNTQAVAIGRDAAQRPFIGIFNASAVDANVQVAPIDQDSAYTSFNGTVVTAGTMLYIQLSGPLLRLNFATDPGTGVVTVAR